MIGVRTGTGSDLTKGLLHVIIIRGLGGDPSSVEQAHPPPKRIPGKEKPMRIQIYKGQGGVVDVLLRPKRSRGLPMTLLQGVTRETIKESVREALDEYDRAKPMPLQVSF